MKLIETAVDKNGKSYIHSQKTPGSWNVGEYSMITDLFFSAVQPTLFSSEDILTDPTCFDLKPGQVRFFRSDILPTLPAYEKLEEQKKIPLKQFFYHSTTTLDYIVVHKGKLVLIVADNEIKLEEGDCIVQRGAAHAWHNYTNETASIFGIMVGV